MCQNAPETHGTSPRPRVAISSGYRLEPARLPFNSIIVTAQVHSLEAWLQGQAPSKDH